MSAQLTALDVGPLHKIRIGHDNAGGASACWHLAYVEVLNKSSNTRYVPALSLPVPSGCSEVHGRSFLGITRTRRLRIRF